VAAGSRRHAPNGGLDRRGRGDKPAAIAPGARHSGPKPFTDTSVYRGRMPAEVPPFPDVVEVVVEIPRGSRNKYEWDEEARVFRLDRVLSSAVFYNFDYGFITGTRADDGDHTDALLVIDEPTFTGCHVWARPVGGLEMRDERGFDFKVLCVAVADPNQAHIERLDQMRPHRLVEIEHFFETYKLLEAKETEVLGWRDRDRAREVLRADRAIYDDQHRSRETVPP
jgi:inorganic pyrophosphatase